MKDQQEWWGRIRGDGVNGGSELLIVDPRAAHSHDLSRHSSAETPAGSAGSATLDIRDGGSTRLVAVGSAASAPAQGTSFAEASALRVDKGSRHS